jgi:hypothetical protein
VRRLGAFLASLPSTSREEASETGFSRASCTRAGRTRRWSASSTLPFSLPGACTTPTNRG